MPLDSRFAGGWTCYIPTCGYANLPFSTICEGCWWASREGAHKPAFRFQPGSETGDEEGSEWDSDSGYESCSEAGSEASSSTGSEASSNKSSKTECDTGTETVKAKTKVALLKKTVVHIGEGESKVVATRSFARPRRANSEEAKALRRAQWMEDDRKARQKTGM